MKTSNSHAEKDYAPVLTQEDANEEKDLQEVLRDYPDILPMEDLGLDGPLLIVGKETRPGAGAIDLMGLAKGGELALFEFKTGPKNPDFRHALAQLIDYGSQLWKMNLEQFENLVKQYFNGPHCKDSDYKGKTLCQAVKTRWGIDKEEKKQIWAKLAQQLKDGNITYVLVAQRFTSSMERQMHYMNHVSTGSRFFAAELVCFRTRDGHEQCMEAFECRVVVQPDDRGSTNRSRTNSSKLLDAVKDDLDLQQALDKLIDYATELNLSFGWGTLGVSLRLISPRRGPITIAWLYPHRESGFRGLTGITLGYERRVFESATPPAFEAYAQMACKLPGGTRVPTESIRGWRISPKDLSSTDFHRLHEEWEKLVDSEKEE